MGKSLPVRAVHHIRRVAGRILFGQKGEHPDRLQNFLCQLNTFDWNKKDNRVESVKTICASLIDLAHAEVVYYYKMQIRKRRISDSTRFFAFILGGLGLVMPFVEVANPSRYANASEWGYVLIALGTASLAGNRLFGSTAGHIRNVTAQYALARAMTEFRLEWQLWIARLPKGAMSNKSLEEAFLMLGSFAASVYTIIEAETQSWGEEALAALDQFESGLDRKRAPAKASSGA